MVEPYRDRALVVRRYDLGEADRIIVLFTRDHGLVRGVAKGVRRAKSRFGSRLSPFVEVDVNIYPRRGLSTIAGADTVRTWAAPLVDDYARYTCACAVLDVAERIVGEEQVPAPELWDLTTQSLDDVAAGRHRPELLLTSYILRAMAQAGWQPSLFECAGCGKAGPHHAFSPALGGAVCTNCRPPGADTPPTEVLHLMWQLAHEQWAGIDTSSSEFEGRMATARTLTAKYLQYYLGRRVPALEHVDAFWQ